MNEKNAYAGPDRRSPPGNLAQREIAALKAENKLLAGAQFAARLHLQTVELQATINHNQQQEIDRLNAKLIDQASESTRLRQQLAALEERLLRLNAPKN